MLTLTVSADGAVPIAHRLLDGNTSDDQTHIMQPAAGAGARLMPPTYSGSEGAVYLREKRKVAGELLDCVLLDGQASQSNRLEEGLLDMMAAGHLRIPDIHVHQLSFRASRG